MSIQERRKEMLLLVEQWHESGQTQKDFARDHGITKSKMGYWVRKAQQKEDQPGFVALTPFPGEGITLRYPNGIELMLPSQTPVHILKRLITL